MVGEDTIEVTVTEIGKSHLNFVDSDEIDAYGQRWWAAGWIRERLSVIRVAHRAALSA
jgi:hypothetical protein